MNTAIDNIKAKIQDIDNQRKALIEEIRKDFFPILKPVFDKYPDAQKVSWRQYTPYFNDGDECIFGMHGGYDSIDINGVDYYNDENYEKPEKKEMFNEFADTLGAISEEFYKDLFGDHVEVTILRNGEIETEEYDND